MVEWTGFSVELTGSTDAFSWLGTVKEYARICYLIHLARLRPLPHRKLRKCHLRKAQTSLKRAEKQAKRRYGL